MDETSINLQLKSRGINNADVLRAMREVDRQDFVPEHLKDHAHEDRPLPIGEGQTISQPYIVAYMLQELDLQPDDVVLEIGTGCGYNAAVMAKIARKVYSIEIVEELVKRARASLANSGTDNVEVQHGDGFEGWSEHAPYDAITLTAAPNEIPNPLTQQLRWPDGHLIAPLGEATQQLIMVTRNDKNEFYSKKLLPVSFVPMTGKAQV